MKELSIEEKAKRYDDAIEVAQRFYNNSVAITKKGLEDIFPELKESEDELARKEMLEYCYKRMNNEFPSITIHQVKRWLAWLEKQGEQKPADKVEQKFKVGDKVLVDGKVYIIKLVNEDNYIVDENGRDVQEHFSYTKDWKLYEQKPTAWSEEDATALGDALWCCKQAASIAKNENDMGNVWYAETWLKAIKDRVQPNQEWSKEDEGFLCKCLGALGNPNYCYEDGELECMRNWLKFLRPQNRWKPSDEQMDALRYVTNFDYGGHKATLVSLYEQLKKLKE